MKNSIVTAKWRPPADWESDPSLTPDELCQYRELAARPAGAFYPLDRDTYRTMVACWNHDRSAWGSHWLVIPASEMAAAEVA